MGARSENGRWDSWPAEKILGFFEAEGQVLLTPYAEDIMLSA